MAEHTGAEQTSAEHTGPGATHTDAAPPQGPPDHRRQLAAAQTWVADLLQVVRPEQYAATTPCADFVVSELISHVFGVADRSIAMAAGHPAASVSAMAEVPADVPSEFARRIETSRLAWSDDAALSRLVEAPFGRVPGAAVVSVYLAETVTHGWDLAVATGQEPEADPELAMIALATMQRALPAEGRTDAPFDDAVPSASDAGPTERLANWLGRRR